ncbi:LysR family transcriptional regulator, partial [Rhodospirillaceae bacterium]|nr:LysR family transcriptional regulator [Rhodospirillaceae bacterium]
MKDGFKEGNKVSKKFEINLSRTITVAGGEFDVYATPEMVRDIERTCKDYILKFADEGEDSVGTKVEIAHVGATLLNMSVEITAVVQKINGRHIIFEVCVKDDIDIV